MIAIHNIRKFLITETHPISTGQYQTIVFETDDGPAAVTLYFEKGAEPLKPTAEEKE